MPSKYVKKLGSRSYRNWDDALLDIIDHNMSNAQAIKKHNILYGTMYNRYHGLHHQYLGKPTTFTKDEKETLCKLFATCAEWGFPLSSLDLRLFAQVYLECEGKILL
ncbi:hypothetical protein PGB90_002850 [Kerria lacca]